MSTLLELRKKAKELHIPGIYKYNKSELITKIEVAEYEAKLLTCPRCFDKIEKMDHVLEYFHLESYREKYRKESDQDSTMIIDDSIKKIYFEYHSYNPIKPSDYEWRRRNYYGYYETWRLIDVCKSCVKILIG